MTDERQRWNVVVTLGQNGKGRERRAELDAAAARAGLELGTWARRVLLQAAGVKEQIPLTREEFEVLTMRLQRLELLVENMRKEKR